jgi:hypothetical protein
VKNAYKQYTDKRDYLLNRLRDDLTRIVSECEQSAEASAKEQARCQARVRERDEKILKLEEAVAAAQAMQY